MTAFRNSIRDGVSNMGQAFSLVRGGQAIAAIAGGSEAVFAEGQLRA